MGTRSTVKFYNRNNRCLLSLYNQYDGYYSGVGTELLEFLESDKSNANGFEDMVLLYVCFKKKGNPYNTYATIETDNQEFNYEIFDTEEGLKFNIIEERYSKEFDTLIYVKTLFWGGLDEFKTFIEAEAQKEQDYWNSLSV